MRKMKYFVLLMISFLLINIEDVKGLWVQTAGEGGISYSQFVEGETFWSDYYWGYRVTFLDKNGAAKKSIDVFLGNKEASGGVYFSSNFTKSKYSSLPGSASKISDINPTDSVKKYQYNAGCNSDQECLDFIEREFKNSVSNKKNTTFVANLLSKAGLSTLSKDGTPYVSVEKLYTVQLQYGDLKTVYADSVCNDLKNKVSGTEDIINDLFNPLPDIQTASEYCAGISQSRYIPYSYILEKQTGTYTGTGSEIGRLFSYLGRSDVKKEGATVSINTIPGISAGTVYGINKLIYNINSDSSLHLFGELVKINSSDIENVKTWESGNAKIASMLGLSKPGSGCSDGTYSLSCLYNKEYAYNLYLINIYDGNIKEQCNKNNYNKSPWYRDWNPTANACCPINTKYNETTQKCENDTPHVKKTYICNNQANVCSQNNGINSLLNGYTAGYEQLENGGQTSLNDDAECILYNGLYLVDSQNSIYCNENITTNFSSFANDLKNNGKSIRAGMLVPIKNFPSVTVLRTCYAPSSVINKTDFETHVKDKIVTPALNFSVSTKYFDNQYSFTSSKGTITASKLSSGKTSYDVDYNRIAVSATYEFSYASYLDKYINMRTAEPQSTEISSNQYKTVSSDVNFKVPMDPKEKEYEISLINATKENNLFLRILDSDFVSVKSPNNKFTYDLSNIDGQLEACGGECKITYNGSSSCPAGITNMKNNLKQYSTDNVVTETNSSKTGSSSCSGNFEAYLKKIAKELNKSWKDCMATNADTEKCKVGVLSHMKDTFLAQSIYKNVLDDDKNMFNEILKAANTEYDQCWSHFDSSGTVCTVDTTITSVKKAIALKYEGHFPTVFTLINISSDACKNEGFTFTPSTSSCSYTWTFKTTDSNTCTQAKSKLNLTEATSNFNVDKNSDNCNTNLVFNNRSLSNASEGVSCGENLSVYETDLYKKLIFRPIDLSNPFPGRSGSGRISGENWNQSKIFYFITSRQDVYEKKPLYSVTLTPANISEIRKYNDGTDYDDFNLNCTNGSACYSSFIRKYLTESKSNCYIGDEASRTEAAFNSCADYSSRT